MSQTHWLGQPLPHGIGTKAFWSIHPTKKLIVFVHGFRGKALTTWTDFATLLQNESHCAGCDLLFYGYDGFKVQAPLSGRKLESFVHDLLSSPSRLANRTLAPSERRPDDFRYERVLIVGHSLGAIVVRRAILDAHAKQRPWLTKVHMAFFAPAHSGANVIELAGQVITGLPYVGRLLAPALKWRATVLQNLEPNAPVLRQLLEDTITAVDRGAQNVLPSAVWFGEYENIVSAMRFAPDPPLNDPIPGKGHLDVCKPRPDYRDPVDELVKLL